MSTSIDHGGTDLGRRVQEGRRQAGLSREEAAARAGMATGYLAYLETSPAPFLGPGGVGRFLFVEPRGPVAILVSGQGHVVAEPGELATVSSLGIAPWAGGHRDTYIRIVASDVTGRRIRASA